MATAEKPKERPSVLRSIIAGSTAGAVEIGEFDICLKWGIFKANYVV
jgi:hypothetical protein